MLDELAAKNIVDALDENINAAVDYWAGGIWGTPRRRLRAVFVETPYVTPDGRTSIQLMVGSDDDGQVVFSYGDILFGSYSDDWMNLGLRDNEVNTIAMWITSHLKFMEYMRDMGRNPMPAKFTVALYNAYRDITDGGE